MLLTLIVVKLLFFCSSRSDSYDSSLSVITSIRCPLVMTPTETATLILRCKVGEVVPSEGCDRLSIACGKHNACKVASI